MRSTLAILAAFVAASAVGAIAQDRPPLLPTRDVAITYRVSGGQEDGQQVQTAWVASERRLRADYLGRRESVLADLRASAVVLLDHGRRVASDLPRGVPFGGMLLRVGLIPPEARLTRQGAGSERIAGQDCVLWRVDVRSVPGGSALRGDTLACVAVDGTVLRLHAPDGGASIEATRVDYGSQDLARFQPPSDYRHETAPR